MRQMRGMSLVEVLLGLTIGAMLFTAVATAVHASANAVKYNERFFKATQTARIAMLQMTTIIRQAESCQPGSMQPVLPAITDADPVTQMVSWPDATTMAVNRKVPDSSSSTGFKYVAYEYRWYKDTGELTYGLEGQTGQVLARGISNMTFRAQSCPRIDPKAPPDAKLSTDGEWVLENIQIDMTVTTDNQSIVLSNSVVPRKSIVLR